MRIIYTLLVTCIGFIPSSTAQSTLPKGTNDSLWSVWNDTRQPDTNRLKAIHRIAWHGYMFSQPDSAYYYAQLQYNLAKKQGSERFMGNALYSQGTSFHIRGDYAKAIDYYILSLDIYEKIQQKRGISSTLSNMGGIYEQQGDYAKAIDCFARSLSIDEEMGDKEGIAANLNNIGNLYQEQEDLKLAMDYHVRSLSIREEMGDMQGVAASLNNIGIIQREMEKYDEAMANYARSLSIMEELGDNEGIAIGHNNIGNIHMDRGDLDQAMDYFARSLKIREEMGDKRGIARSLINIVSLHQARGNHDLTVAQGTKALELARETGTVQVIKDAASLLHTSYKVLGNHRKALEMYELHIAMRDSIESEENQREVMRQRFQYEYDKMTALTALEQEKKDAVAEEQLHKREVYLGAAAGITFLLGIMSLMAFLAYRAKLKGNIILEKKNHLIGRQKKEITDSIQYAENIQRALMPQIEVLKTFFSDSFILFSPKDMVSGDFYWMTEREGIVYLAVGDCTGHGVPGAMLSVIGLNSLNRCISDLHLKRPKDVLMQMTLDMLVTFEGSSSQVRDGMDISLCAIDLKANKLSFAGANNPVWIARNNEMLVLKASRRSVGYHDGPLKFEQEEVEIQKGDMIFLSSDGFQDQLGGTKGKKYMTKNFRELLLSISTTHALEQYKSLSNEFNVWKGDEEQTDDVCVMGVRLS